MNVPHLTEWLGDWAMEPDRFQAAYRALQGLDLHVHMQTGPERAAEAAARQSKPIVDANIAIVALQGPLMKSVPSAEEGTSTVIARRKIREAAADPNIGGILLFIDSPGGTVAGTGELAADVARAAKQKPVYAYIDDLGASAAYWVASQATKVFANETALVGSIGVLCVLYETSARAAMLGIKAHVVKTGAMKGAGVPGTEITPDQLAEIQTRVNAFHDFFIRGVAAGRGLSPETVSALADGRVHLAADAQAKGLIDGVQALDATKSQLAAAASNRKNKMDANHAAALLATAQTAAGAADTAAPAAASVAAGGNTAAGTAPQAAAPAPAAAAPAAAAPATAQSATLAQLKAACSGASNDFLVSQLETGATLDQARAAWMAKLSADNGRLATENAQLRTAGPASGSAAGNNAAPGANPVPAGAAGGKSSGSNATGDASIDAFETAVSEEMDRTKKPRHEAIKAVCTKDPEMRDAMVAAHNAKYAARARRARD